MGLFDSIQNAVLGKLTSQYPEAGALVQSLAQQHGGIGGIITAFKDKGLGDIVASWISTGKNLPISTEQLQSVLGSEVLKQVAAKAGIDPSQILSKLATQLPQLVDQMTPDGKIPSGDVLGGAMGALKGMFGGK